MTYGTGTRSYNRSAEKRESDRQRAQATLAYESGPRREVLIPAGCPCCRRIVCAYGPGPIYPGMDAETRRAILNSPNYRKALP